MSENLREGGKVDSRLRGPGGERVPQIIKNEVQRLAGLLLRCLFGAFLNLVFQLWRCRWLDIVGPLASAVTLGILLWAAGQTIILRAKKGCRMTLATIRFYLQDTGKRIGCEWCKKL